MAAPKKKRPKKLGPGTELTELKTFAKKIEKQFLLPYLTNASLQPNEEEHRAAAAYIVLFHGALENYVEGVSLWALNTAEKKWREKNRSSVTTASLLLHHASSDSNDETKTVFDTIRLGLERAKRSLSTKVGKNNGITVAHLRELLKPVGIDVPSDPVLIGSLEKVISVRHQWAHQYRYSARVYESATDAKKLVEDCVILAEKISDNALKARPW